MMIRSKSYRVPFLVFLILIVSSSIHAQSESGRYVLNEHCDAIVTDEAHILQPSDLASISTAAMPLVQQGADVRIRTVGKTSNLDLDEKQFIQDCPSWQNQDRGMKSTLLVLMVSPTSRKLGLYFGSAWHTALDDHWNRIKNDAMAPRFKDGNYPAGFIAAEEQLAARLKASKDESLHPNVSTSTTTTTTTVQPTDFSGLWVVLDWFLALVGIGSAIALAIWLFVRRKRDREAISRAQTAAVVQRNLAANAVGIARDALSNQLNPAVQAKLQSEIEAFSRLAGSVRTDPEQPGLSAAEYDVIGAQYHDLANRIDLAMHPRIRSVSVNDRRRVSPEMMPEAAPVAASPVAQTTVNTNTNTIIPIFEPPLREREPFEPEREEPKPEHSHRSRAHRDDDDDSSSSSSSSSSRSGSSSSGGGSSDWSTPSTDWGGGGSSDFGGGGGDSGGGGSSGF